jgi:hypothetical protein
MAVLAPIPMGSESTAIPEAPGVLRIIRREITKIGRSHRAFRLPGRPRRLAKFYLWSPLR